MREKCECGAGLGAKAQARMTSARAGWQRGMHRACMASLRQVAGGRHDLPASTPRLQKSAGPAHLLPADWEYDYEEVVTPNIFNFDLWKTSGHAEHYR